MKKFKKPKVTLTKQQLILYGGVFVLAIVALGATFYMRNSKQLAFEEAVETSEQALKEDLQQAAAQNAVRVEAERVEQQKITDAEQAKKSAAETQSAEDKAANRYSNVYGAAKVYESTCGPSNGGEPKPLVLSYDRSLLGSGQPFTVTVRTPDGGPLGMVFVNVRGGAVANPSSFSSTSNTSSFNAQIPGFNAEAGPTMDMGGPGGTPGFFVSSNCSTRSFSANISAW